MASGSKAVATAAVLAALHLAPGSTQAQPRIETRGDQSPAVSAGGNVAIAYGLTPVQVAEMVAVATGRFVAAAAEARRELGELQHRLGVTEGAALTMLRTLGRGDIPVERLPQALADLAERHKELLTRLRHLDDADPEVARLKEQARAAVERGDYAEADRLLRGAEDEDLAAARRMRASSDRRLASAAETRAERARLAELGFRYAEAARLFREAADLVPEANPTRRAGYLDGAGRAWWKIGVYAEAEAPHRRALALRERVFGPDHPSVAASTDSLAMVLSALGRPAEAEPLHRRALAVRERVFGPDHPSVAASTNNLAVALLVLGRPAEAEPLHRRILALRERVLGPDDLSVATSAHNLAAVLAALGRPTEAEPLHRRVLATFEHVFGPDQPAVATSAHNLAAVLAALGHPGDAEPLLRRALAIRERAFGPDHPLARGTRGELEALSSKLGAAVSSTTATPKPPAPQPATEPTSAEVP